MLALPAVIDALVKAEVPDLQELTKPFLVFHDPVVLRSAIAAYKPQPGTREPWGAVVQAYKTAAEIGDVETTVAVLNSLEPWVKEGSVQDALRLALVDWQRNARIAAARLLRLAGAGEVPEDPGPAEGAASELACNVLATAREDRTTAVIETTRGSIEIELFRKDAPLTVGNFLSLAKRGFYDGLSFMRVVPFFVIQGGDPRNDQEGGPGYAIRCEINMRPYERGSVGMALSGKDTGGSQFFITLAPQPHLDGRYTCFGRVLSGMQVAERIVPGDRIRKVIIREDSTILEYRSY
jgi:cyclophilin family peptidyl-prolyl cis-trans isomerase